MMGDVHGMTSGGIVAMKIERMGMIREKSVVIRRERVENFSDVLCE